MKKLTVLFVLAALLALVGSCSLDDRDSPTQSIPDPDPNPNPSGNPLTLKVGQTGTVVPFGMKITFDTVLLDNRCPDSAMCFSYGVAVIRLEVGGHGSQPQGVIFHIDPDEHDPDSTRYVVTPFGKFRIDLRTLDPFPIIDSPIPYEDYSVTLSVRPFDTANGVVGEVVPSVLPLSTVQGSRIDIDSLWIVGNMLTVAVTYGGGCERHQLTMFLNPPTFAESYPAQANLYLYHNNNGDACRALVQERLTFSLRPVVDLYWEMYGRDDPFRLNVHDLPNQHWRVAGSVLYEPPEVQVTTMLPMAIGNFWVYADTVWRDGVPEGSIDTVEVINRYTDSLGDWWELSQPLLTLGDRIMVKGDSIYSLQYCWDKLCAAREYIPAVDTPLTYGYIIWGDIWKTRRVSRVDTSVTVPAGTFDGLYRYEDHIYCSDDDEQRLFKPYVGFIYRHVPCIYSSTEVITRRAWLVEYHLEE